MKVLILISCAFALATAGWAPVHHGPIHIPVLTHGGVPQDTPEVQHARAAHLAALGAASAHAGPYDDGHYDGHHDNGHYDGHHDNGHYDDGSHSEHRYHGPHAYPTTHGAAHVTHDGVPLETPEVAAAKAHHFAAFSEALSATAHHGGHGHGGHYYRKRRSVYAGHHGYHGPIHIPVLTHGGVPVDTPEVQHARAAHLAALASAGHGHGHVYAGDYDNGHVYAGAHDHAHYGHGHGHYSNGFFGLTHDGHPLDEPVVAHAKQAAAAAFHEAAARNAVGHHGHGGHWGHY